MQDELLVIEDADVDCRPPPFSKPVDLASLRQTLKQIGEVADRQRQLARAARC